MRFIVRQKILSFGDSFTINDENNNPSYKVVGKLFSLGDQLKIYDMFNEEKLYIQQKLFKLLPEYHLFSEGNCIAIIKKEFTFFKPRFNITSNWASYSIDGDLFGYNFHIIREGNRVASVSKAFFAFKDTYTVDIHTKENEVFLLALCIVIDQILHDKNHNNH